MFSCHFIGSNDIFSRTTLLPAVEFKSRSTCISAGDPIKGIFQIYSGKIKVVTIDGEKEQIIRLAKEKVIVALMTIIKAFGFNKTVIWKNTVR